MDLVGVIPLVGHVGGEALGLLDPASPLEAAVGAHGDRGAAPAECVLTGGADPWGEDSAGR